MTSCIFKELLPQSKVVKEPGNNKEFILLLEQVNVFNCANDLTSKVPLIPLLLQISVFKRGVC